MKVSLLSPFVRVEMFKEYITRDLDTFKEAYSFLRSRDDKHRNLNKKYGYREEDGTYGIGCKTHIDEEYKKSYDEIESEGSNAYNKELNIFKSWKNSQSFTICEYLLFHDFASDIESVDEALAKEDIKNGLIFNSIDLHARHLIKQGRDRVATFRNTEFERTFTEGIEIKLEANKHQIIHHKRFLKIKIWHFRENKFIKDYFIKLDTKVDSMINSFLDKNYRNIV